MKSTNNLPVESLRKSIDSASQKSKESIKTLMDVNSRQFEAAIETNKKTFDSISKMLYDKEMDPSIVSSFKGNFVKSMKLSEDAIDSIIDVHRKRIDISIDFASKFMELMKDEDLGTKKGNDKLVELIKENFDKSTHLSLENMEKMVAIYNNHLNLVLNFNKKFAETMSSQIGAMFKIQKKGFEPFFMFDMTNEWWKAMGDEKSKSLRY